MVRATRFLGLLPLLFISGNASAPLEIPAADAIANWPAPAFWTPPSARAPRGARTDGLSPALPPLPFVALNPCRVADTRGNGFTGAYGPPSLSANLIRSFTITGQCGIPASASAVSFNFAALNVSAAGDLRVFPAGGVTPTVSTLNYNGNTPNIANASVVGLGTGGAINIQADATAIDLVPNSDDNSISVVRASTGAVLATLTGNGLNGPGVAAFDGQRVLVTNTGANSLSLWKVADLTPIQFFTLDPGTFPFGVCSDGVNFWVTFFGTGLLARF